MTEVIADPDHRAQLESWTGRPPGGESLLDVAVRAVGWLASVDDSDEDTVVVAHGALIVAVLAGLDRQPREDVGRWRPRNCERIDRVIVRGAWIQLHDELRREASGGRIE